MQRPLISVIVPCYGVERFLDRCMHSLLSQSLSNIEIILVDDESPDHVPQMCEEYKRCDNRVKVIHKKNEGLGYARNSGLEIAKGEYVAFVDSDDYVSTDIYHILYETASHFEADIVFCGFFKETKNKKFVASDEVEDITCFSKNKIRAFMLDMIASAPAIKKERKYYMSVWHAIYRRSLIERCNGHFMSERDVASEDLSFQLDVIRSSQKIIYIPDNLYYYCLNNSSLTATFDPLKFYKFKYLYKLLSNKFAGDQEIEERLMRFFIGYTRTQIHHLTVSNYSNKKKHLLDIVNDQIWNEIRIAYPISKILSIHQKIIYCLVLGKHTNTLFLFSKVINLIRKIRS